MFRKKGMYRCGLGAIGGLLVGMSPVASAQFAGFGGQVDYAIGAALPTNSVAADFDGDGDLDLAFPMTTLDIFGAVAVMLNNGDGTFGSSSLFSVGGDPRDIVAGDVDLDGDFDLVVVNAITNDCSVLLNNGDGTFQPEFFFSVGSSPKGVALSDVNADGFLDIITTSSTGNSVSVTLGDGTGTGWTTSTVLTTNNAGGTGGLNPRALAVVDLNADSLPDIVTVNADSNTCTVLYNVASNPGQFFSGDFAIFVNVGATPVDVQVGDVDRDGDLDLVTANRFGGTVSTRLSTGGTFPGFDTGSDYAVPAGPVGLSLADIDSPAMGFDGDLDIIVSCETDDQVAVLINDGVGNFVLDSVYAMPMDPQAPAMGDFDSDGDLDLAVPSLFTDVVSLFFNQSTVVGGAPPTVDLISPFENGCLCEGFNQIVGTVNPASGTALDSYILEYRKLGTSGFTPIASGSTAVINNVLGNWDTTGLAEGRYLLRLRASNTGGIEASDEIVVILSNNFDTVNGIFAGGFVSSGSASSAPVIGSDGCVNGTVHDQFYCGPISYTVDYRPISGGAFSPVDPSMPVYSDHRINDLLATWDTVGNAIPDGDYEVQVVGSNDCNVKTDLLTVRVDNTMPIGVITSPASCGYKTPGNSIVITGTASDTNLASWTLQYTGGDSSGWVTIASGSTDVIDGVLGTWDTTGLVPCSYTIRLRVTDQAVLNCGSSRHQVNNLVSFDLRCRADMNEDGALDFFDVSAFLQAFAAGCP